MVRLILALAVALSAAACAPTRTIEGREVSRSGTQQLFDEATAARVTVGLGKSNVRAILGDPLNVSFSDAGNETWLYQGLRARSRTMTIGGGGYTGGGADMDQRTMTVQFDRDGIVRNVGRGGAVTSGGAAK